MTATHSASAVFNKRISLFDYLVAQLQIEWKRLVGARKCGKKYIQCVSAHDITYHEMNKRPANLTAFMKSFKANHDPHSKTLLDGKILS